jgi:hypothetical protein
MQIAVLGIDLGKNSCSVARMPLDVWSCDVGCAGTAWSSSRRGCLRA